LSIRLSSMFPKMWVKDRPEGEGLADIP